jgi:uncharacterized protein YcbK (DUF882 family)
LLRKIWVILLGAAVLAAPAHAADALAYRSGDDAALARAAAAGHSHVLYERSPGGVFATAARTAHWRALIDRTARGSGFSPGTLEAMVFLESAGRADVIAGGDPAAAAGLAQIMAETGEGFLGMRVDLARSRKLTRRIDRAWAHGKVAKARRLEARRRVVDQRFSPPDAVAGMVRYLTKAHGYLGRNDLAVASYHMGIGNLQNALGAYHAKRISYVRLYFDSAPDRHARAWRILESMSDDSRHYYFKVLAAKEIMRLYRHDQARLAALATLHSHKLSGEEAYRPPSTTPRFQRPRQVLAAWRKHELAPLPRRAGLSYDRSMGEMARRLHRKKAVYRGLRPTAAKTLEYIGRRVKQLSGGTGSLVVTSALRDIRYQRLLLVSNSNATAGYSLHTTGYAFDIAREYRNDRQAAAFQFVLERLQSRGMIEWIREPEAIHVAVMPRASLLLHPSKPARVEQPRPKAKPKPKPKPRRALALAAPRVDPKDDSIFSTVARLFSNLRV